MSALDVSRLDRFLAADPNGPPVVMLNLIRFAPGGQAKYMQYIERFSSSGGQRALRRDDRLRGGSGIRPLPQTVVTGTWWPW